VQQRLPSLRVPPIGFAHRGARAHAQENTLEAFRLALKLGATGLESDVWLTKDGEAVLDHDGVVRGRFFGVRPIGGHHRAGLPVHIPTLGELYDECGTDFDLSLDLKDDAAIDAVLATARNAGSDAIGRLWVCHPQWQTLATFRSMDADVKLVDSTRLRAIREGTERRAATLADAGIDALNMHHTDWNGGLTTLLHRFERFAFAWDLQHDHLLRTALRMGMDGVFSDHTDRMMEALNAEVG
jgi:glycerophosphoryl diester phosphodiesterase